MTFNAHLTKTSLKYGISLLNVMGIDSTTETLESYFHPDSSKDMKLQERQTVVVVVFLILAIGGFLFYIVAEVAERRLSVGGNVAMKEKLSPTPKTAPMNRFRDNNTKRGGMLDTSVLRTNAAGTDVIV
jgi:CBS domain containing-hemolysin-like protein